MSSLCLWFFMIDWCNYLLFFVKNTLGTDGIFILCQYNGCLRSTSISFAALCDCKRCSSTAIYACFTFCCAFFVWVMMTSSNGDIFRVTGHLCGEFTGWVNNREASDLRRHCAHYDVIVMIGRFYPCFKILKLLQRQINKLLDKRSSCQMPMTGDTTTLMWYHCHEDDVWTPARQPLVAGLFSIHRSRTWITNRWLSARLQ